MANLAGQPQKTPGSRILYTVGENSVGDNGKGMAAGAGDGEKSN